MKHTRVLNAIMVAAAILLPHTIFGQGQGAAPSWIDDTRRAAQYPASEWYVGFSIGTLNKGEDIAKVRARVEKEAQNKLAEGITVRIQATSTAQTKSQQTKSAGSFDESIRKDYGQIIQSSTDAEVGKVEVTTYHDQANNRVYALAVVKKSVLAAYYVSRIEFYLQNAENDFKLAQQFAGSERKGSALEKIAEARKNIDESAKYNALLSAVDYKGDVKRLLEKSAGLLQELAALETKLKEASLVFITGREIVDNSSVDILIPGLQNKFTEKGCRIADSKNDAGYVLTVEVTNCLTSKEGAFFYCYACVKADLVNTKTGKSEAKLNFTGPKAGWTTTDRACRKAFEDMVEALWKQISEKTEVCK